MTTRILWFCGPVMSVLLASAPTRTSAQGTGDQVLSLDSGRIARAFRKRHNLKRIGCAPLGAEIFCASQIRAVQSCRRHELFRCLADGTLAHDFDDRLPVGGGRHETAMTGFGREHAVMAEIIALDHSDP